ncbi:hypothetical protein EDD85DRAFT_861824 [Armillaria nabsnona]|nr:hypothetical protein EDD85DRAFT_861824 [Armillaria nabsnona]
MLFIPIFEPRQFLLIFCWLSYLYSYVQHPHFPSPTLPLLTHSSLPQPFLRQHYLYVAPTYPQRPSILLEVVEIFWDRCIVHRVENFFLSPHHHYGY